MFKVVARCPLYRVLHNKWQCFVNKASEIRRKIKVFFDRSNTLKNFAGDSPFVRNGGVSVRPPVIARCPQGES